MVFAWIDWIPLLLYFGLLVFLAYRKYRIEKTEDEVSFLLSGRRLTLPAFVATLVSTWYGGILGVGEYSYQFGVSQWLIFGFPFYVFAIVYALVLAHRIRKHDSLSIPEALRSTYGQKSGYLGAVGVFVLVSPAPYILMLGMIMQAITGSSGWMWYAVAIAIFSAAYVMFGGFGAVVRTDILQIILMYGGFAMLIFFAWDAVGPPSGLWEKLPDRHKDFSGGHTLSFIVVWFFIALWTFVDPSFHQRTAAARTPETARNGILVSVLFWMIFDLFTLVAGLYAFVILPGLENPVLAYPELANHLLGAGYLGLFYTGMIAVVMSTLDSYLFLSGQTLGRDFLKPILKGTDGVKLTRIGIFVAVLLGLFLVWMFPSVIDLWYVIGSIIVPVLLIPVLGIYLGFFRMKGGWALSSMVAAFLASSGWLAAGIVTGGDAYSYAFLGIEPFYAGLTASVIVFVMEKGKKRG